MPQWSLLKRSSIVPPSPRRAGSEAMHPISGVHVLETVGILLLALREKQLVATPDLRGTPKYSTAPCFMQSGENTARTMVIQYTAHTHDCHTIFHCTHGTV